MKQIMRARGIKTSYASSNQRFVSRDKAKQASNLYFPLSLHFNVQC